MIRIHHDHNGITIVGHANYDEVGRDIVCAGITALVEQLILSIEKLTPNTPVYQMEPGYVNVKVGSPTEDTKLLIDCFFIGAENISKDFPNHVRVTRRERR